MSFFAYILANLTDEIYIGHTSHLAYRLAEHNDPAFRGTLHTKRHSGPWMLVHSEEFATRAEAMAREKKLKTSRGRAWIRQILLKPRAGRGEASF